VEPLPVRGPAVRDLDLPLPPAQMPRFRSGRPLKRWRYLGVYTSELMLCVGNARVVGVPQRWWVIALPHGTLLERTTTRRGGIELALDRASVEARAAKNGEEVSIELALRERSPMEVVSPHGRSYIWTAKRAPVAVRGQVRVDERTWELDGEHAFIDDSGGYHARHTAWRWSAGVGRADDGRRVAWNLVDGVHDAPTASERTVWVDGEPREVEPQAFAPDLSRVGGLTFRPWAVREHSMSLGLVRSRYSQPFGTFGGELPGGLALAEGYGVMEDHDVTW
jgi:Domain of unknown function (DUF2804), C-terminal